MPISGEMEQVGAQTGVHWWVPWRVPSGHVTGLQLAAIVAEILRMRFFEVVQNGTFKR